MHIVLVTRALDFGGAERQLVQLANGLARRGHRVTVITFYPGSAFDGALHTPNPALVVLGKRGRWILPVSSGGFCAGSARLIRM